MMKHLIRYVLVLFLISFFITPVSAEITEFDASVNGNNIVVTGTTSVDESVDITSLFVTEVDVVSDEYVYELKDVSIPDVNGDEKLTISAHNVEDMKISLDVGSIHIWNTTIIADAGGVASYYTTGSVENNINFIIDEAGIGGTVLGKPVKWVMSYASKFLKLNIKITGTSTDSVVYIEQVVNRTISASADDEFLIKYKIKGLPGGTYVMSAATSSSSESVEVELKSTDKKLKGAISAIGGFFSRR